LQGTGAGTYTIKAADIQNGQSTKTEVFAGLPVTTTMAGQINLSGSGTTLSLDNDGDGTVDQSIEPSAVLSGSQQDDFMPPVINIVSPENQDYLHSDLLSIDYSAVDDNSGILSISAELDGASVSRGQNIDLFYQPLGSHSFNVAAKDNADNQATASVQFRVIATIDSTISDINRAYSLGWINKKSARDNLINKMNKATKLVSVIQRLEDKMSGMPKVLQKIQKVEKRLDKIMGKLMLLDLSVLKKTKAINQQAYDVIFSDIDWIVNNN